MLLRSANIKENKLSVHFNITISEINATADFEKWVQTYYRNADKYSGRDYEMGLASWKKASDEFFNKKIDPKNIDQLFINWAQVHYRNVDEYNKRDYDMGLAAWKAFFQSLELPTNEIVAAS